MVPYRHLGEIQTSPRVSDCVTSAELGVFAWSHLLSQHHSLLTASLLSCKIIGASLLPIFSMLCSPALPHCTGLPSPALQHHWTPPASVTQPRPIRVWLGPAAVRISKACLIA